MNKKETGQLATLTQKVCDFHNYTKEQFDVVHKRFDGVNSRLDKLNGKVEKNTTFRNRMYGGLNIGAWLFGGGGLVSAIFFIIKNT